MGNTRTTDENAAAALDGTEWIRGVQLGQDVKMTAQAIANLFSGPTLSSILTAGALTALPITSGLLALSLATSIVNLAAGTVPGQTVKLYTTRSGGCTFTHGNSTGGAPMILSGGSNFVATQYSNVTLFWDGASWIECARMTR